MSDDAVRQACDVCAPSGTAEPTKRMRISGTGSTGAANATALTPNEMATIKNASTSVAIRIGFGATSGAAITDAATGILLMGGERFDWMVSPVKTGGSVDQFVAVVADDGASGYKADAWTSSGPRSGE